MGILRYLFAIAVVFAHIPIMNWNSKPFDGNGGIPVQAFFVISGFYMSLIFEKYNLSSLSFSNLKRFYIARALRIYPTYYLCLFIMIVFLSYNITPSPPFHFPHEALKSLRHLSDQGIYLFENLFIFGQSLMRFCIYDSVTRSFLLDPMNSPTVAGPIGAGFAIMGQAWTLSLELTFYLLVPFILNRSIYTILALCAASFALRIMLIHYGYDNYNFQHAFFPTALGVFLLGTLSHRIIYPLIQNKSKTHHKTVSIFILSFTFLYAMVIYHHINNINFKYWFFILFIAMSLPYLFCHFKESRFDRWIGEFSYPIYMSHFLCIALVLTFFNLNYIGYYVILCVNLISLVIIFLLTQPLNKLRHSKIINKKVGTPKTFLPATIEGVSTANG